METNVKLLKHHLSFKVGKEIKVCITGIKGIVYGNLKKVGRKTFILDNQKFKLNSVYCWG